MDKMIVYEDDVLLVVHKPVGIATETARVGQADLVSELKNYRKKKGEETYIGVIHRLDQPVEGLLVFAKDGRNYAQKDRERIKNLFYCKKAQGPVGDELIKIMLNKGFALSGESRADCHSLA